MLFRSNSNLFSLNLRFFTLFLTMKKIQRTFIFSAILVLVSACSLTTAEDNNSDSTIVETDTLENEMTGGCAHCRP